ncbi:MAG: hydroxymethylglutaryl-CoA lyase [Flavobacteriales bacterium]|nr:hydroxymethylglutaryl-CoA lyase [Flavobacteriales bacterium]
MSDAIQLIECPRDAMQGIHDFIPTDKKVAYINSLLNCGFHTLDCGSFVSPKAIPQMADTSEVLDRLHEGAATKLSVIVANKRGALDAVIHSRVDILGFPFSVSDVFQQRNTNATREEALDRVKEVQELCIKHDKQLLMYLSMAFGNPYDEKWHPEIVAEWTQKMAELDIQLFMPSDTIGSSTAASITAVYSLLNKEFPKLEIGAHLHTTPDSWKEKLDAAWDSGCRRFDSALKGLGGCPMAKDDLTGNMPTERVLQFLEEKEIVSGINQDAWMEAMMLSGKTFPSLRRP